MYGSRLQHDGFFGIKFKQVKAFVEKQQSYQVTKAFKKPGATTKGKKVSGEDKGNGYTTVRAPRPGTNLQIVFQVDVCSGKWFQNH
eukprot:SAG31_NODE_29962_length_387_cov_0.888889_1_plen_85_part_01